MHTTADSGLMDHTACPERGATAVEPAPVEKTAGARANFGFDFDFVERNLEACVLSILAL